MTCPRSESIRVDLSALHNPCSYLLLKKLKNRALGMLSRGLSVKRVTEQREAKSSEKERRLPG